MTPAHRFARVLVLPQYLCGWATRLAARSLHRPSLLLRFRDERLPSVSADEQSATGWLALLRPALRQYAEHEPDAFDRLLLPTTFDYEHSRRVRSQHLFEACASPLRPGLAPRTRETGGPGGSRRRIRFSGWLRVFARRFFFRVLPVLPCFWHPCRWPVALAPLARGAIPSSQPRPCRPAFREERLPLRSGMPSIASLPRHARVAPTLENGHVRFPLRWGCQCFFARRCVLAYVGAAS